MMRILYLLLMAVFLAAPLQASSASSGEIAIVVNDGVITKSDLDDRLRLIMVSSGLPNNPDILQNLVPQIMGNLIEEQIRVQEAERLELDVSQGEINEGFAEIAKNNNFEPEQFREIMKNSGINISTLEDQIRSQLAWKKVVQTRLTPQVNVSERDVDNMLERLEGSKGKTEYLISEIFLPIDDVKEEQNIRQLAGKLVQEIRTGQAPFGKVAQQFSKSAGASQGGDRGWIQEGQLAEELDAALPSIAAGQIGDPIRSLSGLHILLVRDQRIITDETIPDRDGIFNYLGQLRLQNLARRYFLDLKSSAFIDNRLDS
jgi:peptidyl-prolyl cis-trans isomerase SurA